MSTVDRPGPGTEKITEIVRSYLALAGHGSAAGRRSADDVAALFADDAIFESSPGGDVRRGIDAIRSAYHSIWDDREQRVDLLSLDVTDGEATSHVQVVLPDGRRADATDVMTFDDHAKISSLRTYVGRSDLGTPERSPSVVCVASADDLRSSSTLRSKRAPMSSSPSFSVVLIGSGQVAQASIAR